MLLRFEDERPIYLQIADGIEDAILAGAFPEGSQVPSTTEISVTYNINPATALKGINLLVERGILYKKRGLGMFVADGAAKVLAEARKEKFYEEYVLNLAREAKKLKLSLQEVQILLERGFDE